MGLSSASSSSGAPLDSSPEASKSIFAEEQQSTASSNNLQRCTSSAGSLLQKQAAGNFRRRLQQDIIGPFHAKQHSANLQPPDPAVRKDAAHQHQKQEVPDPTPIIITTALGKFSTLKTLLLQLVGITMIALLIRLILSCASGGRQFLYQTCTDSASNPSFLNLTAVLNITTAKAVVESKGGWMAKIAGKRRPNKKHAQRASSGSNVHMVYMADAYAPEAGSVCFWRSHDQSFNWLQQPGIPFFKPSIIASAFTPPSSNGVATFLKTVNADKVPEDWHIEAFGSAVSKACDQVRKKSASMMHWANFDDILVPSRLCNMADRILLAHSSTSSTKNGPAATIGSMLRLAHRHICCPCLHKCISMCC